MLLHHIQNTLRNRRVPVHFKPIRTLGQRLVHSKDRTPKPKLRHATAVQCSKERSDFCTGETKQLAQHKSQKSTNTSSIRVALEDQNVHLLDTQLVWEGVKEDIYIKQEKQLDFQNVRCSIRPDSSCSSSHLHADHQNISVSQADKEPNEPPWCGASSSSLMIRAWTSHTPDIFDLI